LDELGFTTFSRLVGTGFQFYPGLAPVKLELLQVAATAAGRFGRPRAGRGPEPEEFSLIFRGPHDQPLLQETYPVAHGRIGRFVMFIAPIWPVRTARAGRFYEAAFNRRANLGA
jgi:hypothetical protein